MSRNALSGECNTVLAEYLRLISWYNLTFLVTQPLVRALHRSRFLVHLPHFSACCACYDVSSFVRYRRRGFFVCPFFHRHLCAATFVVLFSRLLPRPHLCLFASVACASFLISRHSARENSEMREVSPHLRNTNSSKLFSQLTIWSLLLTLWVVRSFIHAIR